jgi:hypothetical protein
VRVGCVGSSFPGRAARSGFAFVLSIRGASWRAECAVQHLAPVGAEMCAVEASSGSSSRAARAGRLGPAARSAPPARAVG